MQTLQDIAAKALQPHQDVLFACFKILDKHESELDHQDCFPSILKKIEFENAKICEKPPRKRPNGLFFNHKLITNDQMSPRWIPLRNIDDRYTCLDPRKPSLIKSDLTMIMAS
jgi:hypothetical protein